MRHYELVCPGCGVVLEDHYTLSCPQGCDALIRARYQRKKLGVRNEPGIFRFADWLPVEGTLKAAAGPVTYRSEGLARDLGLKNLYIGFNGYWPERGAEIHTCSFKELEALPTMVRVRETGDGTLVVASAGNTGRAFCQTVAATGGQVVVVVPEKAATRLWTTVETDGVCMVLVDGDYSDTIAVADALCAHPSLLPEGGARNVARRDGMGTVMLDAAVTIGRLPDRYFQAVGSGTGGIAAWEAAMRLVGDGRFGQALPRLHLVQNLPFVPMVRAWEVARREIVPATDMPDARTAVAAVYADVLTNRKPPYGIGGGVFDTLTATRGTMHAVTNPAAEAAARWCEEAEGIDLDPAAAVALAALADAVETGSVGPDEIVLLNLTGGGYRRVAEDHEQYRIEPAFRVSAGVETTALAGDVLSWVRNHA
ncbi:cysteate synthase [Methanofollis aquaemaris]|uniref:Cysteate synthase n=1 Tax=Methanofollis aquaemaris TaxID=126734 RepID=A0A8A3S6R4_9EURY|nr:cysteate synthase [Methanofollis aquaemaris]QSZ67344.1 cysteate synthase [Methanofollis aquaemaris]